MYTVYCTNYSKGNECLERSLAEDESLREFIDVRRERRKDNEWGRGGEREREEWRKGGRVSGWEGGWMGG